MSRALARRNAASELGTGLRNVALSAGGGAALGAGAAAATKSTTPVWPNATLGGASAAVGLATVTGLVVALVSPRYRNAGLATTGVGVGTLILAGIASSIVGASTSPK